MNNNKKKSHWDFLQQLITDTQSVAKPEEEETLSTPEISVEYNGDAGSVPEVIMPRNSVKSEESCDSPVSCTEDNSSEKVTEVSDEELFNWDSIPVVHTGEIAAAETDSAVHAESEIMTSAVITPELQNPSSVPLDSTDFLAGLLDEFPDVVSESMTVGVQNDSFHPEVGNIFESAQDEPIQVNSVKVPRKKKCVSSGFAAGLLEEEYEEDEVPEDSTQTVCASGETPVLSQGSKSVMKNMILDSVADNVEVPEVDEEARAFFATVCSQPAKSEESSEHDHKKKEENAPETGLHTESEVTDEDLFNWGPPVSEKKKTPSLDSRAGVVTSQEGKKPAASLERAVNAESKKEEITGPRRGGQREERRSSRREENRDNSPRISSREREERNVPQEGAKRTRRNHSDEPRHTEVVSKPPILEDGFCLRDDVIPETRGSRRDNQRGSRRPERPVMEEPIKEMLFPRKNPEPISDSMRELFPDIPAVPYSEYSPAAVRYVDDVTPLYEDIPEGIEEETLEGKHRHEGRSRRRRRDRDSQSAVRDVTGYKKPAEITEEEENDGPDSYDWGQEPVNSWEFVDDSPHPDEKEDISEFGELPREEDVSECRPPSRSRKRQVREPLYSDAEKKTGKKYPKSTRESVSCWDDEEWHDGSDVSESVQDDSVHEEEKERRVSRRGRGAHQPVQSTSYADDTFFPESFPVMEHVSDMIEDVVEDKPSGRRRRNRKGSGGPTSEMAEVPVKPSVFQKQKTSRAYEDYDLHEDDEYLEEDNDPFMDVEEDIYEAHVEEEASISPPRPVIGWRETVGVIIDSNMRLHSAKASASGRVENKKNPRGRK